MFVESGHMAARRFRLYDGEGETLPDNTVHNAQDLHAIIDFLLRSYREVEKNGMLWDFVWEGKTYPDTELLFFIPNFKVDNEEADKLCGKFLCRTGNVAQLCRYCLCPTEDTDNHMANYPLKTEKMIKDLTDARDHKALKALSQQPIDNALHGLRFGLHNKMGIHGACPGELLHSLLLGIFKYVRDCFFAQVRTNWNTGALEYRNAQINRRMNERNAPYRTQNIGQLVPTYDTR